MAAMAGNLSLTCELGSLRNSNSNYREGERSSLLAYLQSCWLERSSSFRVRQSLLLRFPYGQDANKCEL